MTEHEREQLLDGIRAALAAGDMPAAATLIGRLAVHYPGDARAIADAVTVAGRVT